MKNEELRKVQLAQLEIAKEIKKICENNNIPYFLEAGTLLGAVRHKGFIPWDDDMDFSMTRADYEKFILVASKQLPNNYHVETWDTNDYNPYPFAKVMKKDTRFVEAYSNRNGCHELWVDIFPRDNYPNNSKEQERMKNNTRLYRHLMIAKCGLKPWRREESTTKRIKLSLMYIPFFILSIFYSKKRIQQKWYKELTKYNTIKCQRMCLASMYDIDKYLVPSHCIDSLVELEFEKEMLSAPSDYDNYLKSIYGNYMELPPEEQRENRHKIIEIKL